MHNLQIYVHFPKQPTFYLFFCMICHFVKLYKIIHKCNYSAQNLFIFATDIIILIYTYHDRNTNERNETPGRKKAGQ